MLGAANSIYQIYNEKKIHNITEEMYFQRLENIETNTIESTLSSSHHKCI